MLAIIIFILSSLGIYGFFCGNLTLLYIGFGAVCIEHFLGISSGEEKGITTIIIALSVAVAMIIRGYGVLISIAICMCFESTICFALGFILMVVLGISNIKNIN